MNCDNWQFSGKRGMENVSSVDMLSLSLFWCALRLSNLAILFKIHKKEVDRWLGAGNSGSEIVWFGILAITAHFIS